MIKKILILTILTFIIGVSLSEIYNLLPFFQSENGWLSAAIINSLIAIPILLKRNFFSKGLGQSNIKIFDKEFKTSNIAYFPSILLISVVTVCSSISSFFGSPKRELFDIEMVVFITWIPIVEEIVFRMCIGKVFREYGGFLLGGYFSSLCFSLVHTLPTLKKAIDLNFGAPLGPFLLGIICEFIYVKSGKIFPAIIFHAACNSTVLIFSLIDSRWLDFFSILYL